MLGKNDAFNWVIKKCKEKGPFLKAPEKCLSEMNPSGVVYK